VSQQFNELSANGRTMRLTGVGKSPPPPAFMPQQARPSSRRSDEERERRHRERAIASWLRSLSR
jgi:hypothetical protein